MTTEQQTVIGNLQTIASCVPMWGTNAPEELVQQLQDAVAMITQLSEKNAKLSKQVSELKPLLDRVVQLEMQNNMATHALSGLIRRRRICNMCVHQREICGANHNEKCNGEWAYGTTWNTIGVIQNDTLE